MSKWFTFAYADSRCEVLWPLEWGIHTFLRSRRHRKTWETRSIRSSRCLKSPPSGTFWNSCEVLSTVSSGPSSWFSHQTGEPETCRIHQRAPGLSSDVLFWRALAWAQSKHFPTNRAVWSCCTPPPGARCSQWDQRSPIPVPASHVCRARSLEIELAAGLQWKGHISVGSQPHCWALKWPSH